MTGRFQPRGTVVLTDLRLLKFDKNLVVDKHIYYVFNAPCQYNMIAGRDFMLPNEMTPDMKKKVVT